ncbi:MAG TPA: VOC family protein [Candidatus Binatia bacterium]|jgi:catechol 2,3-dioxygenase-like lactoylglutathione lyase family enzyme
MILPAMILRLHHLALRTGDVRALGDFYREVFALAVVRETAAGSLWLRLDDASVLMIEPRTPGEPVTDRLSMELVAFSATDDERKRIREMARSNGFYDGETDFTVYLRDPDGRRIGVSTFDLGRSSR